LSKHRALDRDRYPRRSRNSQPCSLRSCWNRAARLPQARWWSRPRRALEW